MNISENIIEIRGLTKTFTTKNGSFTALNNIDLDIERGEIFGIIGLSGAGKSTLVRCINRLEAPTGGTITFDGREMGSLKTKELNSVRREMGMIFQQFNLLMQRTALQNVCFPMIISGVPKAEAIERAKELLGIVGLSDRMNNYPSQLSGGQKQRVAIARALATNPKVLLCDEATSALDPTTTQSILNLIREINKTMGITVVIITHEMSVIEQVCRRVAIIDNSQIVEVGRVDELFRAPKTDIAKKLIFPNGEAISQNLSDTHGEKKCVRIVFDGKSSFEPVVSNLVLECGVPVNILFANTKNIDGIAYGQMLLQLPDNELSQKRVLAYLSMKEISYTEEMANV